PCKAYARAEVVFIRRYQAGRDPEVAWKNHSRRGVRLYHALLSRAVCIRPVIDGVVWLKPLITQTEVQRKASRCANIVLHERVPIPAFDQALIRAVLGQLDRLADQEVGERNPGL